MLYRRGLSELVRNAESLSQGPVPVWVHHRAPAVVHPTLPAHGACADAPAAGGHVAACYRGLQGAQAQVMLPLPSNTQGSHDWPGGRHPQS